MKTLKKQTQQIAGRLTGVGMAALALSVSYSHSTFASAADTIGDGVDSTGQSDGVTLQQGIEIVTNILLFLIGVVAVVMIVIGGIRYTTSNGDASQTKAAKDTILYSVVGLVVAIMAYALVRWVVNTFVA